MFTDYFFPELGGIQDSVAITSLALAERGTSGHPRASLFCPRLSFGRRAGAGARSWLQRAGQPPSFAAVSQFDPTITRGVAVPDRRIGAPACPPRRHPRALVLWHRAGGAVARRPPRIPVIGTNHTTVAGFAPHIPIAPGGRRRMSCGSTTDAACSPRHPARCSTNWVRPADPAAPSHLQSNRYRDVPPGAPRQTATPRGPLWSAGATITYAGRLGPEKNIDVLLRALAALREHGSTPNWRSLDMARTSRYCGRWPGRWGSRHGSAFLARSRRENWQDCYGSVIYSRS